MKQHEFHQALTQLHEELNHTTEVDDATRQALTVILADIQRLVANPSQQPLSGAPSDPTMALKLQATIQDFEINHPRLTGMLQKVVDRLAEMGI